jgi:hypothetical protein
MKKNIFISSTYIDLKDYREEVWKLLENYNVNILGMEKFGARKETPLETCLNEVERADIYIGIVGTRFGSLESESNKSYTQLEYEKALKQKKEILIYLVDDEAQIKVKAIDFKQHKKLENFKQLLKEKHTVDFFKTPQDLSNRLKNRLDNILTTKELEKFKINKNTDLNLLEMFFLFPNKYKNNETIVNIKLLKKAIPLSKEACKELGFKFGKTIITKIDFLDDIDNNQIKYLIIPEEKSNIYFDRNNNQEIKILSRLIFSEDRIDKIKASFVNKINTIKKRNPDYAKNPFNGISSYESIIESLEEPKYLYDYEVKKCDAMMFLELIKEIA